MPHLPIEILVDFIRGLGDDTERAVVMQHISECRGCTELMERLTELAATTRSDKEQPVPDDVVDAAVAMFTSGMGRQHRGAEIARLVFDSNAAHAAHDATTTAPATRQLFFESSDAGLRVKVTSDGGAVSLEGRITPKSPGAQTLATIAAARDWDSPTLDNVACSPSGEFKLAYAAPAAMILHVSALTWRRPIAVPIDVQIGAEEPVARFAR